MADNDILIEIKTILDHSGLDAAKAKIQELKDKAAADVSLKAGINANIDKMINIEGLEAAKKKISEMPDILGKAAAAAGQNAASLNKMADTAGNSSRVFLGLTRALSGGTEGFVGAAHALTRLVPGLGLVAAGATALWGAWKLCSEVMKSFSKEAGPAKEQLEAMAKASEDAAKALTELDKVKLTELSKSLSDLVAQLNELKAFQTSKQDAAQKSLSARQGAEIAEADTMADGPEKTRKMAELKRKHFNEQQELNKSQREEEMKSMTFESRLVEDKRNVTRRKADEAKRAMELTGAELEFEQKRWGGSRPEEVERLKNKLQEDTATAKAADAEAGKAQSEYSATVTRHAIRRGELGTEESIAPDQTRAANAEQAKGMNQAAKEEKAIADKKAQEEAELAKQAKIDELKKKEDQAQDAAKHEKEALEERLRNEQAEARAARFVADSADPRGQKFRRNRDRKAAESNYDEAQISAAKEENDVAKVKALIAAKDKALQLVLEDLAKQTEDLRRKDKANYIA